MILSLLFSVYSLAACVINPSSTGLPDQIMPYTYDVGQSVTLTASGCSPIERWKFFGGPNGDEDFDANTDSVTVTPGSGAFSLSRGYFIAAVADNNMSGATLAINTGKRPPTPNLSATTCELDPDAGSNKIVVTNPNIDPDLEDIYSHIEYEFKVDDEILGREWASNPDGSTQQEIFLSPGAHAISAKAIKFYDSMPNYAERWSAINSVFSDSIAVSCPEVCDPLENCHNPNMNSLGKPIIAPCKDQSCKGDPVNLGSGALWHQNTDYSVKGRTAESSLSLTRTYLSDNSSGDFGNWHHNFETKLTFLSSRNIIWHDENGGQWMLFWQNDAYVSPKGEQMRLVKNEDHYLLEKADHTKLKFFLSGKLLSITDRHGEVTSLNYDSGGKIESVSVPFAGSLVFTRNSQGRVASSTLTRDNLTTNYSYDADGKLLSVTDFANNAYEYTYITDMPNTAAQGHLASIKDPLNRTIRFTYYPDGRAHTQIEPGGGLRTFQYVGERPVMGRRKKKKSPSAAAMFSTIIKEIDGVVSHYFFDENYRTVEIVHPDLSKSETMWNNSGRVEFQKDEIGHPTYFTYDTNGNTTAVLRPGLSTSTQIIYDPIFRVPTQIVPAVGAVISNTLDSNTGDILRSERTSGTTTMALDFTRDAFGNLLSTNNGRTTYTDVRDANGFDLSPIFTTTLKVTTFFIVILSKVYYLHCFINSIGVKFFKLECGLSSL